MKFDLTVPCVDCPFLINRQFPLSKSRKQEIARSLEYQDKSFLCHKTTSEDDEGEYSLSSGEQHCAGALILLEKLNRPNQMMRIMERIGGYDRRKLKMDSGVYDSFRDWIQEKRPLSKGGTILNGRQRRRQDRTGQDKEEN